MVSLGEVFYKITIVGVIPSSGMLFRISASMTSPLCSIYKQMPLSFCYAGVLSNILLCVKIMVSRLSAI